jgi:hypothetical protein
MSRPLRFSPHRSLVLVTQRTFQGRLLLRPSAELNDLVIGLLGKAQARHGMVVHACAFLSNHFHLLVSPESAHQLADFMRTFTARLGFEVGRLQGWEGPVFPIRYRSSPVTDEEPAQVEWLRYVLAHGCKEGLVARPTDWPGVHAATALAEGRDLEGHWVDRSALCEARRRKREPDPATFCHRAMVHLTPLPCWADLSTSAYRSRIQALLEDIELERAPPQDPPRQAVLGCAAILQQDPHTPVPPPAKRRAPWVLAASRAARQALVQAYRDFVLAFREAARRLKEGARDVVFPPGSFPPPLPRPGA